MRKISLFVLASIVALPAFAFAQPAQGGSAPLGTVVDLWVTKTEHAVVPAAEALPEGSYGFAPNSGEFTGVRTFAEQVKHLAAANYQLAALVLGGEPPAGTKNETAPASVQTKSEIMAYLRGSFTSLHLAATRIDSQNAEVRIQIPNGETENAVGLVIDAIAHSWNHYGQIVEYLRMNRIVPPASR